MNFVDALKTLMGKGVRINTPMVSHQGILTDVRNDYAALSFEDGATEQPFLLPKNGAVVRLDRIESFQSWQAH